LTDLLRAVSWSAKVRAREEELFIESLRMQEEANALIDTIEETFERTVVLQQKKKEQQQKKKLQAKQAEQTEGEGWDLLQGSEENMV
jgi:hypothetical protein